MGSELRPVVVCVDDEPPILAALKRSLRREPLEVLTTEDPDQALAWVVDRAARVVLVDQRMPSMSGLQLLELVKIASPSTCRVMLTGQSDLSGVLRRRQIDSIQLLIRKPWDDEVLRETLRDLAGAPAG